MRTPHSSGETISYVDVALTPNISRNGYILLIDGGDVEANEAAARYLLNGPLGSRVSELLTRKNSNYFEIFLRGRHISGEADDSFEVVAIRPLLPTAGTPKESTSGSRTR